jgi:hypothetical protein
LVKSPVGHRFYSFSSEDENFLFIPGITSGSGNASANPFKGKKRRGAPGACGAVRALFTLRTGPENII